MIKKAMLLVGSIGLFTLTYISNVSAEYLTIRRNDEGLPILIHVSKDVGSTSWTDRENVESCIRNFNTPLTQDTFQIPPLPTQSLQIVFFDKEESEGKILLRLPINGTEQYYISPEIANRLKATNDLNQKIQILKEVLPDYF